MSNESKPTEVTFSHKGSNYKINGSPYAGVREWITIATDQTTKTAEVTYDSTKANQTVKEGDIVTFEMYIEYTDMD